MKLRLAVIVSHPIQYFAPWYRQTHRLGALDLRVFFCCDWGVEPYVDPQFGVTVKWDVPLVDGYPHEFLSITRRPTRLSFWAVDNPDVGGALARFAPDILLVHGYAYRTAWRVATWARRQLRPLMLYSDSSAALRPPLWRRLVKQPVVRHFYTKVDGALCVGANNAAYHSHYGLPDERLFPGLLPVDIDALLASASERGRARNDIRERWNIPRDAFVVMFCGKYAVHKRPLDLAKAVRVLSDRRVQIWALLVGEGEERRTLEQFCNREQIKTVVLAGFVNQSQIARYYAAADALAVPSSRDQHALVITEAAAFGLPAIVSDKVGSIGPAETAQPGINALVYRAGDIDALSQAIERLCIDRAMHRHMSEASVRIAREQTPQMAARALVDAAYKLHQLGPRGG